MADEEHTLPEPIVGPERHRDPKRLRLLIGVHCTLRKCNLHLTRSKSWDDVTLKRRVELMLALPLSTLDAMAIQRQVRDIGVR